MNTQTPPPRCDFCNLILDRAKEVWTYPASDFAGKVTGYTLDLDEKKKISMGWGSDGGWSACEFCHDMIEGEHWYALAKRAFDSPYQDPLLIEMKEKIAKRDPNYRNQSMFVLEQMFNAFKKHRQGPAVRDR